MALQGSRTASTGVVAPEAYAVLTEATYDKGTGKIAYRVQWYLTAATKAAGNGPIDLKWYERAAPAWGAAADQYNLVQDGYEWLKAQEDFAGYVDA